MLLQQKTTHKETQIVQLQKVITQKDAEIKNLEAQNKIEKATSTEYKKQSDKFELQVQQLSKELSAARQQQEAKDLEIKKIREQLNQEVQKKDQLKLKVAELEQQISHVRNHRSANTQFVSRPVSGSPFSNQSREVNML